ncbi:hypothetical protein Hdeb2414_s0009g00306461 [Helianthus debilis subsp. tardiflorus]
MRNSFETYLEPLHGILCIGISNCNVYNTGKFVKVDVPQYLIAAKSYALAADSSSSYAPKTKIRCVALLS